MLKLDRKVALVTGGGRNIGAGSAKLLARQGATVIVNDYHADRAESTASAIVAAGGKARASAFDITDREAVNAAVAEIAAKEGGVDILINNAGNAGVSENMGMKPFGEIEPDVWAGIVDINLYGMFHCVHAVLPGMIERHWGRIITHTSGAGQTGLPIGVSVYGAAKSGQIGFMRHLAVENGRHGITCNTISVGLVLENVQGTAMEKMARGIPMGRLGKPEDIAAMDVFLASEEANWITGQVLGVNGGGLMI